jgi:hypothetical protein
VSARFDLFFFIGSCVFTFFFYGLYHLFVHLGYEVDGTSALGTYFVFTAFFDHPHIFQTLCRTHYDREEFHKRPYLYTWGLGGSVVAGFLATALGYVHQLIIFAAIFGSWHVIRQHSGFMKAYKRRNQDINPVDNWLDGLTFYTGMFACFFNDYSNVGGADEDLWDTEGAVSGFAGGDRGYCVGSV